MERNKIIAVAALAIGIIAWRMGAMQEYYKPVKSRSIRDLLDTLKDAIQRKNFVEIKDYAERVADKLHNEASLELLYNENADHIALIDEFKVIADSDLVKKVYNKPYESWVEIYEGRRSSQETRFSFSPDSTKIILVRAKEGGIVELRDTTTWQILNTITGNISWITAQFSVDGKKIMLTGYYKNTNAPAAEIWDANLKNQLYSLDRTIHSFEGVVNFWPDGMKAFVLLSGVNDTKRVGIWNAAKGSVDIKSFDEATLIMIERKFKNIEGEGYNQKVSFSSDGDNMAVTTEPAGVKRVEGFSSIVIWNLNTLEKVVTLSFQLERNRFIQHLAFSPNNKMLLVLDYDTVRIWDVKSGKEMYRLKELAPKSINSALFSSDSNKVITTCNDQSLKIWELKDTFEPSYVLSITTSSPYTKIARLSSDGTRLIVMPENNWDNSTIWDAETGRQLQSFIIKPNFAVYYLDAQFSPNGNLVVIYNIIDETMFAMIRSRSFEQSLLLRLLKWAKTNGRSAAWTDAHPWGRAVMNTFDEREKVAIKLGFPKEKQPSVINKVGQFIGLSSSSVSSIKQ